ncbi:MAG: peptide chain release factor 1 [Candidatus Omnitrophica bacterium]|nr:peptide chain release factor 1 [Candidatus Omnitrophota bacterium]
MWDILKARTARAREIEQLLADPRILNNGQLYQRYAKERAALDPFLELESRHQHIAKGLEETRQLLAHCGTDLELRAMAQQEAGHLGERLKAVERELEELLLEDDPDANKNAVVEIRAGTGGLEATLFASDLYRMYSRYAASQGWATELLSNSPSEAGGFKEIIFGISGNNVYRKMQFERGVHRVQRVPATEASGRIHTSTATVAVMPEADEVDVQIDPDDLKIDVFRSSGAGGQSVNTTDSAVRITHLPTGLVVSCQDERSQLKNKMKGMKILRSRIFEAARQQQEEKQASDRRRQIGTGDRSEKIRTYNFPDRRITDHRIGFTTHQLMEVLEGQMGELVEALLAAQRKARLEKMA